MVMRRAAAVRISFGMAAMAVVLGIVAGLLGSPARALALEPAFIMYGSVTAGDGILPTRVRATIGEVTCGSSEVARAGDGTGFYALAIVSADTKAGCGVVGSVVDVSLLRGEIGPGTVAAQVLFQPGAQYRYDLLTAPAHAGEFAGALPEGAGQALLWWTGASATPIADALATIGRDVASVDFWDASRQVYRQYVPGAPAAVQTYTLVDMGDVVLVRVR